MKRIIVIVILLQLVGHLYGQPPIKTLVAEIGTKPKLDAQAHQAIERRDYLASQAKLTDLESKELIKLYEQYDETMESIWHVIGGLVLWWWTL